MDTVDGYSSTVYIIQLARRLLWCGRTSLKDRLIVRHRYTADRSSCTRRRTERRQLGSVCICVYATVNEWMKEWISNSYVHHIRARARQKFDAFVELKTEFADHRGPFITQPDIVRSNWRMTIRSQSISQIKYNIQTMPCVLQTAPL